MIFSVELTLNKQTCTGSVDHIHSGKLYTDLKTAEESLNLATHLHLLYLVTPYDVTVNIDWRVYFSQVNVNRFKICYAIIMLVLKHFFKVFI